MADSTPNDPSTFDWREIVSISQRFSEPERKQLEEAMERIARVPEGAELIKAAAEKAGGQLGIWQPEGSRTTADFNKGVVNIDFEELSQYAYNTPNGPVRPSITGVLVHELSHLGRDPLSPEQLSEAMSGAMDQAGRDANVSDPQKAISEFARLTTKSSNADVLARLAMENPQRQEFADQLRAKGSANVAEWLEKVPPGAVNEKLQAQGILNAENELATEVNAVNYTDRFMEKYFIGEPQRGTTSNAVFLGETNTLPPTQITERQVPFEPVQRLPLNLLEGLDLSALRGVTSDGQRYSAGDTGSLAATTVQNDRSPTRDGAALG